jgi:hypothetical protein
VEQSKVGQIRLTDQESRRRRKKIFQNVLKPFDSAQFVYDGEI